MQTEYNFNKSFNEPINPFLLFKNNGKIWLAGHSIMGLCSAYNHTTNPGLPMSDSRHSRARQYAKAIKNRMNAIGFIYGIHYKELSTGALWPIKNLIK